jgi:predicted hydrocarbon binding protein
MTQQLDFEQLWVLKFSRCLDAAAGEDVRQRVMEGSEALSSRSSREEVVAWSKAAMERLEVLVPEEDKRRDIMTGCACQYPRSQLAEIRQVYEETGDLDLAHQMLQQQFESFLRDTLQLQEALIDQILSRGWGSAGLKEGSTVIATKIPKSGYLLEYMQEENPQKRRQIYCHCPRVRDAVKMGEQLPRTYCYCGAGFYKGIWEEILQQPVRVEVLESVLQGGDACTIAIHLPGE